ncbi:MAG: acetate--CoA ligase family protein [Pseudomonadales bacterium]|jgi:acetyltransferase|nr:acetate--CoA ligase family protein [Pseudomonadales bacterium]
MKNLDYIFQAKSIAVVGASTDQKKLGSVLLNNLIGGGYKGKLYPVNPKYDVIDGLKCYESVSAIGKSVEQVVILIPAGGVLSVVGDCIKAKVKSILIISAGFGEFSEEGRALEEKITKLCKDNNISLVGPNIIGVINPYNKMNSSWMNELPRSGNIAFVSQSGALCCSALDIAPAKNLGFYNFCSVGNKADINELDLFQYWNEKKEVDVLAAYLEEIRYGEEFIRYIEQSIDKPVVIFKSGKSEAAKSAIASHTGSMAGSQEIIAAAFAKAGVTEAYSTTDFFNYLQAFSFHKNMPQTNKVCIITNAGGVGIIATDEVVQNGLELAKLDKKTIAALKEVLPQAASAVNPVDILGEAPAARYQVAAEEIIEDKNANMVLFILTPQYVTEVEETAAVIVKLAKENPDKIIAAAFIGDQVVNAGIKILTDGGVLAYKDVGEAVRVLAALYNFAKYQKQRQPKLIKEKYKMLAAHGTGKYHVEVSRLTTKTPKVLDEKLVTNILKEVDLDIPAELYTTNIEEAVEFAKDKYPVVIKAPNNLIAHKTDVAAIYLNLKNEKQLREYFDKLTNTIDIELKKNNLELAPLIMIQEMLASKAELFIGANRDGGCDVYADKNLGFGHLLVFGQGGIYTEVYKDLAYALVPSTRKEIETAFHTSKIAQIASGVRGQAPLPVNKIIDAIQKIQKILILYPEIISLDLNPLLITENRVSAVDVKMFVGK